MTDTYRTNATPETKPLTWWDKLLGRKPPVEKEKEETPPPYMAAQRRLHEIKSETFSSLEKLAQLKFSFVESGTSYYIPLELESAKGVYLGYTPYDKLHLSIKDSNAYYEPQKGGWSPAVIMEALSRLSELEEGLRRNQTERAQNKLKEEQDYNDNLQLEEQTWLKLLKLAAETSRLLEKKE